MRWPSFLSGRHSVIPVGDNVVSRSTPLVNYAFILANIAVFIYMLALSADLAPSRLEQAAEFREQTATVCYGFETRPTDIDRFYCEWGFQPKEFFDTLRGESQVAEPDRPQVFLSVVTSIFIHGGWLHIIGNLLFLFVFGDNVEDRLGHVAYAAFYLVAGVFASLVQGLMDPLSVIPVVGASGAVAGVLGAYLIFFPKATVTVVFPLFIFIFIPLPIPAVVMIGLWFIQNLFAGIAALGQAAYDPGAGVAWFAHIGGFVFGMVIALLIPPKRRPAPTWRP